jgi:phosphoglycerate dehydrogenase-like enzyme
MPDTPKTQDLVSRDLLMALDSDAILINAGRGNCIDELDLLWVLDQGHLRYCVLDVFRQEPLPQSHPFWSHPQVYVTSHTSAPTDPAGAVRVFEMNLTRFLNGESLLYAIDFEKGY